MKPLTMLLAAVMVVTMLAVAAVVQLVITVWPVLAAAAMVAVVLRARRTRDLSVALPTGVGTPEASWVPSPARCHIGTPLSAPHGWMMVPVWVAPTPASPIVDAEVVDGRY